MLDSYYKSRINVQKYCNSIIAFNQSLELSLNNNSPFRSKRCHLIKCDCGFLWLVYQQWRQIQTGQPDLFTQLRFEQEAKKE